MVSVLSSKNQSTHGRVLLNELRDPPSARLEFVLDCLRKDPLSGRLKDPDTGDNAYHMLLGRGYQKSFILAVLGVLLNVCPEGVRACNSAGSLPLHLSFMHNSLHADVIMTLLTAYPAGAGVANNLGLIPLFLCVMREDSSAELCRELCKAFPAGASTLNRTGSYPLHFAAKRLQPQMEILRILLRRNPDAAAVKNDFGLLPLHCICA